MSIAPPTHTRAITGGDPRHGRRAGYIAGCREDCCRVPHLRYQKMSNLRRLREGSQYTDPARLQRRLDHWARYGVSAHAVSIAAGLSANSLGELARGKYRPEKATLRAVLAVTWDSLPDTTLVNAGLTLARIYSLMAAGHPLTWICGQVDGLGVGGKWRTQPRVTLGLARQVQAVYAAAPTWGPSRQTATKAQRKGHQPPAAWDDPGLPAMPDDWQVEIPDETSDLGAWARGSRARAEDLEWIADTGGSLTEALDRLDITDRDTLWAWCSRHDMRDVYERLARRERIRDNGATTRKEAS